MSAGNQLDANVLSWVKSEIDETLGQARSVLEVYVDNPEDESQLRFCLNYLHQVHGTLQMVELYGASLAAEEMEHLVEALVDDKVSNRNDAYEVLIRGILQLPDYLEQLLNGQPDMPMVLLPLLNDLRAARGESLLSENAMFTPDLSVEAPLAEDAADSDENKLARELGLPGEDISELAKKLRHHYHLGLLGWFRDKDSDASLKRIGDVINKLRSATDDKDVSRLLWTASALVESLRLGGLDPSVSVKLLLGQLDRQIKKIIDEGVYLFRENPPAELLKNILYYIATSNADGELTQQIKQAFDLERVLPDTQQLEQARTDMQAPNAALMDTVSSVLMDDLMRVKDILDVFVRAEEPDMAELSSLTETLKQMSDTLGMLGLGLQRRTVQEQVETLDGIVKGERAADETTLMDVAAAMISIENSLKEMGSARAANEAVDSDKSATEQLHGAEQHKLMQTVIDEVKIDLAKIKDAISDYSRNTMSPELVSEVPGILTQIKGSLSILSLERAASLLDDCASYVSRNILQANAAPEHRKLENLADLISSIEYYLESLAGKWGQPETILEVAEQSLTQLFSSDVDQVAQDISEEQSADSAAASSASVKKDSDDTVVDLVAPDVSSASGDTLPDFSMLDLDEPSMEISSASVSSDEDTMTDLSLGDLTEPSLEIELEEEPDIVEHIKAEDGLMFDSFDEQPDDLEIALTPETMDSGESSVSLQLNGMDIISPEELVIEDTVASPEPVIAQQHKVDDEIDDEIVEIFLEEAEEEFANIQRFLPMWESNQENEEPLKDMRRSFHTLKGSGRLVGATDIGEFAWAFENMLNRVIDHTINTSPNFFEVLHRGCDTLPVLFELFKTQAKPGQDVLALMSYADTLSKGEDIVLEEPEKESVILEPEESNIDKEVAASDEIDPVLLDIYRKEAEAHLATLNNYITDWKSGVEQTATYALLRALHTLNGSSRTASVQSLSELCGAFENYVKDIEGQHFSEQALGLLEQLSEFIVQTLSAFDVPDTDLTNNNELLRNIISLNEHHQEQQVEADVIAIDVDEPSMGSGIELHVVDDADELVVGEASSQEIIAPSEPAEVQATEDLGPDYDEELLEIFLEEGEEILNECDETIHQWVQSPDDSDLVEALQRQLHTLKGGARMAGITPIGNLGHEIESMLTAVVDGHLAVSKEMQTLLQRSQDRLVTMLEQVKDHKQPRAADDLISEVNVIIGGQTAKVQGESADDISTIIDIPDTDDNIQIEVPDEIEVVDTVIEEAGLNEPQVSEADNIVALDTTPELPVEQDVSVPAEDTDDGSRDRRKGSRIQHEQVRVRSDLLDNLVNFAGEVSIYRSRMEQQTNSFRFNLQELDETIDRFRGQLRQFEIEAETQIQYRKEDTLAQGYDDFDPLEMDRFTQMQHLSRAMLESLGDLDSLRNILSNITRESETLLTQQSRITTELQEGLMRTRMVQVSGQAPRLRRIVRQVSDEMGKPVEFHMNGMDSEMDRTILDRVIPPVEHMLRNAVAHGIEKPEQRKSAGKSESGNVNISFDREGGEFIIRISDDGMGINLNAIRRKAIDKGMLAADAKPSKEVLLELMMQSGFSTAEEVTQIAGRGVGMDVVNSELKQLGGHLDISTIEGKGTVFTISMPLTLAVSRALMVTVGDETYAIPLLSVEGVERVSHDELVEMSQSDVPVYHWVGHDYKYMHMSSIMGMHQAIVLDENRSVPILLVRSGGYRAAIQVDGLIGSREIVVKPVGPQFSSLRGVSGATIMGDGRVVLIIDPAMLVRLEATEKDIQPVTEITTEAVVEEQSIPTVMVVDDSITVRKVTTRFLERHEMAVTTAKDGVDALGQLQIEENKPDIILLDVEMPRMDGFELATNIRNDDRLKDIPIIMITSRTGGKHRDRAMNIGVNAYLGKPYGEAELLENIHNLTGK